MASNVKRDHHNMRRTVSLNGNKISNDGGDEGISVADNGNVTLSGDLDIDGDTITTAGNITLDSAGDIILDAAGADIAFAAGGTSYLTWTASGVLTMKSAIDTDDYLQFVAGSNGASIIGTNDDSGGSLANLTLKPEGDLIFNPKNGVYIAQNNDTEFSAANSAYAGMMLGCSHIFGSGTGGQFVQISTAWENLLWDTDKYALVTFVVPPSNKVKISVHLPYVAAASYQVRLGLATDSSATTLNTKYENDVDDANRSDAFNINYSWVIDGSDHSWSAGETKTLYIMAYTGNNVRFYTGGTNTSAYGGVIVEATALPATIGDGT
jgi:hypothetical protein